MISTFIMDPQKCGNLPKELWDIIFDQVEKKDLLAMSRVCRHLRHLVEPFLYRDINWIPPIGYSFPRRLPDFDMGHRIMNYRERERRSKESREPRPFRLVPYLLLRTLLHRPDLAGYIKHVKLWPYHRLLDSIGTLMKQIDIA